MYFYPFEDLLMQNPWSDAYYEMYVGKCILNENIIFYPGKTVDECKTICDSMPNCLAFEYGVAHGGSSIYYQPGDCVPQSGSNMVGCDGYHYNLDLYVK